VGLAANYSNVHRVAGREAVVAATFLLMVSLGLGFVIGGPSLETRKVFALGTAQRNFSVAFLIAVENFRESDVVGMLAILALVASLVLVPSAFGLRKLVGQQDANQA
jgi:BASS family bile acid:Na+ symporter